MTPKEKAIELVDKYWQLNYDWDGTTKEGWAKDGALIAVDEIIKSSPARSPINDSSDFMPHFKAIKYWEEVKQEIENL
jgi:hypothetical protein